MAAKLTKTYILDTNVLLRFLVGDNKLQQIKAIEWFRQAEKGEIKIIVVALVVAEACFVLESFYKQNRSDIISSMEVFISQRWLRVENRDVIKHTWFYYQNNLHFVDSYLLAWQKISQDGILTFDQKVLNKL